MSDTLYSAMHGESARRQFRISLFMVIALAIGAALVGFVTPPAPAQDLAAHDDGGVFVGRLVASGDR
jgi:hypothetical protein